MTQAFSNHPFLSVWLQPFLHKYPNTKYLSPESPERKRCFRLLTCKTGLSFVTTEASHNQGRFTGPELETQCLSTTIVGGRFFFKFLPDTWIFAKATMVNKHRVEENSSGILLVGMRALEVVLKRCDNSLRSRQLKHLRTGLVHPVSTSNNFRF